MKRFVLLSLLAFGGCASQEITRREYYEPTESTAFKRADGTTVGAVKAEFIRSGSPDWSDEKNISLISIGK